MMETSAAREAKPTACESGVARSAEEEPSAPGVRRGSTHRSGLADGIPPSGHTSASHAPTSTENARVSVP